jgi:DNA-binding transcriptional MerR regulator
MAWEKIGMQWWQWHHHGDSDPKSKYDIKVVVYKGMPLEQIKKLFPVNSSQEQDFRYFEYQASIQYLNEKIKELNQAKEAWAINLQHRLVETKARIQQEIKTDN